MIPCGAVNPFSLDPTSGPVGAYICEHPQGHDGPHQANDITVPCPPIDDDERAVFAEGGYTKLIPWRAETATARWKASKATPPETDPAHSGRPGKETKP